MIGGIILFCGAAFLGLDIRNYLEFRNTAEALSALPWQDGGRVTMYQPVCVSTPPDGVCKNCPQCGPVTGNYVCADYSEIQFTGQRGGTKICPMQGFVYKGGGVMPTVGLDTIVGGISDTLPKVIGVPGPGASRIQRLVEAADFVIAGFRNLVE